MAINVTPVAVFGPNYLDNDANKTIEFTYQDVGAPSWDLPELTDAAAAAADGDARTIIYALLEKVAEWYEGLAPADRPLNMRISRSGILQDVGGDTYLSRTYNVTFKTLAGELPLLPE